MRAKTHKTGIQSSPDEFSFDFAALPQELVHLVGQKVEGTIRLEARPGGGIRLAVSHKQLASHPGTLAAGGPRLLQKGELVRGAEE